MAREVDVLAGWGLEGEVGMLSVWWSGTHRLRAVVIE